MGLLDRVSKSLGNSPVGKTADLVDDLWDKRKEIVTAVRWVADHGDDLVAFMHHIPDLLAKVGGAMDAAGKAAHTASGFLGLLDGFDGTDSKHGLLSIDLKPKADDGEATVAHLAHEAGTSLHRAQGQIGSVSTMLSQLGEQFGDIPLVGGRIADKAAEGSGVILQFSDEMADISAKLAHLAKRVGVVSHHLNDVGNGLIDSSKMLKSLAS